MRVKVEWRSVSTENYNLFCKKHPEINISIENWRLIIYSFNEICKEYMLETGDKLKFPYGFGEFVINKKKRKQFKTAPDGTQYINLPIDWQKTKEKGKVIYNLNYHTEGYFFGWHWFKKTARFKHSHLWSFKACRNTSRLISHYIKIDPKYQLMYNEWPT